MGLAVSPMGDTAHQTLFPTVSETVADTAELAVCLATANTQVSDRQCKALSAYSYWRPLWPPEEYGRHLPACRPPGGVIHTPLNTKCSPAVNSPHMGDTKLVSPRSAEGSPLQRNYVPLVR